MPTLTRRACLLGSLASAAASAQTAQAGADRTLLVVTRSKNANVVHYDVRLNSDGKLRLDEPVSVYWILNAEDGRRESLTWLERQFAYGFTVTSPVRVDGFRVRLAAFDAEELAIRRSASGRYRAHFAIAGRRAVLERIHVESDERGMTPRVIHVDLFGRDQSSGARVSERRRPG